MRFVVSADNERFELLKQAAPHAKWIKANDIPALLKEKDADAVFNLSENASDEDYSSFKCPVFVNSVVIPLSEINAAENVIRINAWPGFIEKEIWEIAGTLAPAAEAVLKYLNKKFITVNDEPGFVTARIISMIINEAFFAKGEEVSTEKDIDIAMKLGTNYPYGPFEWGRMIGIKNIFSLLKKLSVSDSRYTPASALKKEINN